MKWKPGLTTDVRVGYANLPPFVIANDQLEGFMPDILRTVAHWMKLRYTFFRDPYDGYGVLKNGSYDGMIGMLHRNEVDIIMNPVLPLEEHLEFSRFTNPITIEAYTILSGKETEEAGLFLYFSVLSKTVWLSLIVTLILISLTTAALYRRSGADHLSWIEVTFQYAWMLFSYMLKQMPSDKWLLRKQKGATTYFLSLLTSLWVLCVAFLVMNVFQSLLVSKLTLKKSSPYIDIPENLVDKKRIQCIAPREIQIKHVFKKSNSAKFRAAWNYISHDMPLSEAFQDQTLYQVESGKYCVIHGHLIFKNRLKEFFKKYGTCNFHLSAKYFYPFSLPIMLRKEDTEDFYETFNLGITRLVEADITGKWFKSDLATSNLCTSYSDITPKPLGLQHLYGVLLIWLAGMLFGAAIFFVEILTKRVMHFKAFPFNNIIIRDIKA